MKKEPKLSSSKTSHKENETEETMQLKQEVAVLRRQIDSLNITSLNMRKQNFVLGERMRELQESNKNLEAIQKEKDELFAVIVHDIKNPTTIIKSLVELLRSYDEHDEERGMIIEDLVASTKQVIQLSQEISKVLIMDNAEVQMF
jgi:light-regulated signal transduction histidine kinase (bacteriophytochrome)